ncbi:acyltransferase family protein [Bosea sp. 2KB_26]|uniref:acyltransferase family protein n=1 Tax=Bosea sp. 2KB_26 TaxID=3237475 RepID=UPI003F8F2816
MAQRGGLLASSGRQLQPATIWHEGHDSLAPLRIRSRCAAREDRCVHHCVDGDERPPTSAISGISKPALARRGRHKVTENRHLCHGDDIAHQGQAAGTYRVASPRSDIDSKVLVARNAPLPALTSIRFVFAIMVVATHFAGYHPTIAAPWMGPLGNIAVSWFFILSGFILAYNFPKLSGGSDVLKFVISRFWRLFPVQAVTLLASHALFDSSRHLVQIAPSYLAASLTLTHAWSASTFAAQAFNVPAWSISHEWFFYLIFPLLIARGWVLALAITAVSSVTAIGWATSIGCWNSQAAFQAAGDSYAPTCHSIAFYWPPARLWEFALGIAICAAAARFRRLPTARLIQPALVVLAVAAFYYQQEIVAVGPSGFFVRFFGLWVVNVGVGCTLILALSLPGPVADALNFRPLLFAGEISFSVYMTHMLILRYADMHHLGSELPAPVLFIIVCAVSSAVSAGIFLLIEQPSRLWLKAMFARMPGRSEARLQT